MRYVSTGLYEARDGSFAQLKINTGNMVLITADGTCYTYYGQTSLEIKDRNGNKIIVTMNATGDYQTITDTLGRVINFNYGSFNDLQTITQTWDGMTKTLASFSYDNNFQISTNFSTPISLDNITNGTYVPVVYQINFLDGTRYNFQYNSYGQICRIDRKGANNNLRSWTTYNLPANAAAGAQSDCPRFTKRTDWALDWSPVNGYDTNFCFSNSTCPWSDTHNVGKVTTPDGTTQTTLFSTAGWQRGLPIQTETWSAGVRQKWTIPLWQQPNGFTLYQCNPRVYESNVYDKDGNRRRVTLQYSDNNPNDYNRPGTICEYNADATTILRKTVNTYTSYVNTNNRILSLPTQQCLYDGSNALQSKVEYRYDESTLATFPNTPICYTSPDNTNARGNLTSVRRYDINAPTQYVENKIVYYITGAPSCTKDALNHATTFAYDGSYLTDSGATQLNNNTYAYPTHITDQDGFSTDICYSFVRGDVRRTVDPKGAAVRRDYDGMGRLWKVTSEANSAFTCYNFDPNSNYIQSYTTILDSAISNMSDQFYSITVLDGHGRVRTVASDHPGSTCGFKAQYNGYDNMGRLAQQSNWTEINGATWNPAGDDVAGWAWRYQTYDWKGRPLETKNQDLTTRTISYTGCGCAGGQVETICDEGTVITVNGQPQTKKRQQKIYYGDNNLTPTIIDKRL